MKRSHSYEPGEINNSGKSYEQLSNAELVDHIAQIMASVDPNEVKPLIDAITNKVISNNVRIVDITTIEHLTRVYNDRVKRSITISDIVATVQQYGSILHEQLIFHALNQQIMPIDNEFILSVAQDIVTIDSNKFTHDEICVLLTTYSRIDLIDNKLINHFANEILSSPHKLTHKNIADLCKVLTKISSHRDICKVLYVAAKAMIQDFTVFEITSLLQNIVINNSLWSTAIDLVHAIITHLKSITYVIDILNLTQIIWILARLGANDIVLFGKLAYHVINHLPVLNSTSCAEILYAYSHMNIRNIYLFDCVGNEILKRDFILSSDAGSVLCSYSIIGIYKHELFVKLIPIIDNDTDISDVIYVKEFLDIEVNNGLIKDKELPVFNDQILHLISQNPLVSNNSEQETTDCIKYLQRMNINIELDQVIHNFKCDIVLLDYKAIIEINDINQFTSNDNRNGQSNAKYRLLRFSGWKIIAITLQQWTALKASTDVIMYLKNRIYFD